MRSRWLLGITALCVAASAPAGPLSGRKSQQPVLRDRYFGESHFYARQGRYFEAPERLDAELGQLRAVDQPESPEP